MPSAQGFNVNIGQSTVYVGGSKNVSFLMGNETGSIISEHDVATINNMTAVNNSKVPEYSLSCLASLSIPHSRSCPQAFNHGEHGEVKEEIQFIIPVLPRVPRGRIIPR